ncbi:exopolysaccharide Pel transporter PelG [Streptomyces sp. NPDC046939]|uniref:lipopolysaccharide biosynthesis protein n=1 Tax=Streptomyces sp. NPDC046939 TaxID=3155376 RepID=UPI0033D61765
MLNTVVSGVLGVGFWLAAAHYYTADAVGRGSAAIAAMKLLAGLTAVSLTGALARFLPVAGRATGRFVLRTYAWSASGVAFAAVVFLLTLDAWGPSYRFLHGPLPGLGFVAAVVAWSLLTLQDGVLTGLRSALWVPVGNAVFSAVKLALLVAFAVALPATGVYVSWVAAIAFSLLPLGWLVLRRLVPRHVAATGDGAGAPPTAREVGRFLAGDSTGSLFSLAVVFLVPVIIASRVSSADNAYFYVAATVGATVNLLAVNMGASLTVEGSHDPARLAAHTRAALRRMARIMLPVCGALLLLAPYVLRVFGRDYAEAATPLLRLLAVGAALRVVMEIYFAVLRAQSRTSGLAWLQGLLCALVLGLTLLFLPPMGLTGAGVAEVCALAVVLAVAAPRLWRVVRTAPPPAPVADAPPDGDLADLDAPTLRARPRTVAEALRDAVGSAALRLAVRLHLSRYTTVEAAPDPLYDAAGVPDAEPPRPAPRPTVAAVALLLLAALALYWGPVLGMDDADLDAMGGLGLVSVLPPATLAGAALLVLVFTSLLWLESPHKPLLWLTLLATVVSLHALPAVVEAEPRFATAWRHWGFLDHIDRTGTTAPALDARWSWPGFFAAAAFLARACGVDDPEPLLRWWPLALHLLCLAPMSLLLRSVRAHWRARWTGLWIFVLSGWVGQDYFSPQGFTYLLYLVFVAVLLGWFRPPHALGATWRPGETEAEPADPRLRAALLVLLLAVFAATVPAHQLTPFMMLGVLTALVLAGRCVLPGLPLLCGVMAVGWLGFAAEPYWAGHLGDLLGGVGGIGGNVSSSVSGRLRGSDPQHALVLYARVLLAGGVLTGALCGWWRRRAWRYRERSLPVLAFVPFLGLGLQSYGGEMALRVFLFALPGAALLAGLALFPRAGLTARERDRDRVSVAPLAALLAGLLLMGGFLVARWGNEPFERVRPGEAAAMEYVYAHDDPAVRLLWLSRDPAADVTPSLPWGARDMERVHYVPVRAPADPVLVDGLVKAVTGAGPPAYLMVNESQVAFLRLDAGYPRSWAGRLLRRLDARQELEKVYVNEDVTLYRSRARPSGPVERADAGPAGPHITWTPWTVLGALAAVALTVLLAVREVVRVARPPGMRRPRWLNRTSRWAWALLAVVAVALVRRFVTLGPS